MHRSSLTLATTSTVIAPNLQRSVQVPQAAQFSLIVAIKFAFAIAFGLLSPGRVNPANKPQQHSQH